ncbi:7-carboxy-7-deazaguanine synthase [Methylohalomonas lacus]|uniref:7-carboxy-7-deazaguanine synthase n=1 Tax=Methylohalomonas lacus TaxID=398773 RepID=A0AAE3L4P1_9GAMM|nr:7-carboxy-7-deazaguanine synthase QueE [Methylohalomonas lacus]MCS3904193.1 7-carboxy-7-deazaguanine synthase [Methylohalomonas lacus]
MTASTLTTTQPLPDLNAAQLRVNEIFLSLQGESIKAGLPTVFIRLTGCPLRCHYCDTEYAFHDGDKHSVAGVIDQVRDYRTPHVCVTGGEPLAQRACLSLLTALCDAGYQVSLETSGAMDIAAVDTRVMKVLDLKTPASGESDRNLYGNLEQLGASDQIKFVICDRGDYDWAREQIAGRCLDRICQVLLSPSHEQLSPRVLADWILADRLPVRLQLQLHKYLWGDGPGH